VVVITTLFENVDSPDAMIDVADTVPVNVASPPAENVSELLLITSFVVVLYVRQLTASFTAARIGLTKKAEAVVGENADPMALITMLFAPCAM
jgi:hypothetical protein